MLFLRDQNAEISFSDSGDDTGISHDPLKNHEIDLVVMEACGPSGWISDLCQELGLKTFVCSTNDAAWEWKNVKRKTDKDDALKLARLAMMRQLTRLICKSYDRRSNLSMSPSFRPFAARLIFDRLAEKILHRPLDSAQYHGCVGILAEAESTEIRKSARPPSELLPIRLLRDVVQANVRETSIASSTLLNRWGGTNAAHQSCDFGTDSELTSRFCNCASVLTSPKDAYLFTSWAAGKAKPIRAQFLLRHSSIFV